MRGERLRDWLRQIRLMSEVIDLVDAVSARNEDQLSAWIQISDGKARYDRSDSQWRSVRHLDDESFTSDQTLLDWLAAASEEFRATHGRRIGLSLLRDPKRMRANKEEKELRAGRHSRSLSLGALLVAREIIDQQLQVRTAARCLYDQKEKEVRVFIVPFDLLGALWLQASRFDSTHHSRCCQCGKWFLSSPEKRISRRRGAKFCSDPCKSRSYRRKIQVAQGLAAEGVPVTDIAERLGSEITTVKGWISRGGK